MQRVSHDRETELELEELAVPLHDFDPHCVSDGECDQSALDNHLEDRGRDLGANSCHEYRWG